MARWLDHPMARFLETQHEAHLWHDIVLAATEPAGGGNVGQAGVEVAEFAARTYERGDLPVDPAANVKDGLRGSLVRERVIGRVVIPSYSDARSEPWRNGEFRCEFNFQ